MCVYWPCCFLECTIFQHICSRVGKNIKKVCAIFWLTMSHTHKYVIFTRSCLHSQHKLAKTLSKWKVSNRVACGVWREAQSLPETLLLLASALRCFMLNINAKRPFRTNKFTIMHTHTHTHLLTYPYTSELRPSKVTTYYICCCRVYIKFPLFILLCLHKHKLHFNHLKFAAIWMSAFFFHRTSTTQVVYTHVLVHIYRLARAA